MRFSVIETYRRLSYTKRYDRMSLGDTTRVGRLLWVWDWLQMGSTLNRITCSYNDVMDEACFFKLVSLFNSHLVCNSSRNKLKDFTFSIRWIERSVFFFLAVTLCSLLDAYRSFGMNKLSPFIVLKRCFALLTEASDYSGYLVST
jgi:hypothetical protein